MGNSQPTRFSGGRVGLTTSENLRANGKPAGKLVLALEATGLGQSLRPIQHRPAQALQE